MTLPHYTENYIRQTQKLLERHDRKKAMSAAVGGEFEAVGKIEFALLLQHGLEKTHTVLDIGCGSGRLSFQLREFLEGRYVGIDVVRELFEYAEALCERPDWSFYEAPGLTIPEAKESADFICFFSVFTHLTHEESYRYLLEAARVLRPEGKIIISFLEFRIPSHWGVFERDLADQRPGKVLNQFLSRDALETWAAHSGLRVMGFHDGDKPHVKLVDKVKWEAGHEMVEYGHLGQSVCVLTKQATKEGQ